MIGGHGLVRRRPDLLHEPRVHLVVSRVLEIQRHRVDIGGGGAAHGRPKPGGRVDVQPVDVVVGVVSGVPLVRGEDVPGQGLSVELDVPVRIAG